MLVAHFDKFRSQAIVLAFVSKYHVTVLTRQLTFVLCPAPDMKCNFDIGKALCSLHAALGGHKMSYRPCTMLAANMSAMFSNLFVISSLRSLAYCECFESFRDSLPSLIGLVRETNHS